MKQAKGAVQRVMQYWFYSKCDAEMAREASAHNLIRRELWHNLVKFDLICRDRNKEKDPPCAGRFLSEEEHGAVADSMERALDCYNFLAKEASENGECLWKLQPQMHMVTHMAYDMAKEANPRRVQCFADEDMVDRFKRLVHACHAATASQKSLLRYLVLVGLRWWCRLRVLRGF